jgi:hypothetical protein
MNINRAIVSSLVIISYYSAVAFERKDVMFKLFQFPAVRLSLLTISLKCLNPVLLIPRGIKKAVMY